MRSFLIITTYNFPEAYFLVKKLIHAGQKVALLNIQGRTKGQSVAVLKRLLKNRGAKYLFDLVLSKFFASKYIDQTVVPFPEITEHEILEIKNNIDYFECDDVNSRQTMLLIENIAPDFILVAGAPVIKVHIYNQAKLGALNRHLGISPEYRGSDCPIWAMANNEFDKIGFTIHYLSKRVDGGDVLLLEHVDIGKRNFSEALAFVSRQGSEGYWYVIKSLLENSSISVATQSTGGQHYPPAPLSIIKKASNNIFRYNRG